MEEGKCNLNAIRWQCRRGMLELDILLDNFLKQHYTRLNAQDQSNFLKLLAHTDQELYVWLLGAEIPDTPELQALVFAIRQSGSRSV